MAVTRREFLEDVGATTFLGIYPPSTKKLMESNLIRPSESVRPPALEPGMTIGLVAPASHLFEPDRYRQAHSRPGL